MGVSLPSRRRTSPTKRKGFGSSQKYIIISTLLVTALLFWRNWRASPGWTKERRRKARKRQPFFTRRPYEVPLRYEISEHYKGLEGTKKHTVLIYGHGRSGSTITAGIFDSPDWVFHFEPLEDKKWPSVNQKLPQASGSNSGSSVGTCWLDGPDKIVRCPVADMAWIIDELHCRRSYTPVRIVPLESQKGMGEVEAIEALAARPPSKPVDHPACYTNKVGVAIKVIRLRGMLTHLFHLTDLMGDYGRVDLLVHLVRDPRALLASRLGIGWGMPASHSYEDTLAWAKTTCDDTMRDYYAGYGRPNYRLLRYEDLIVDAVNVTAALHAAIPGNYGVPRPVRAKMEENARLAKNFKCNKDEGGWKYNKRPKSAAVQLTKWISTLSEEQERAVIDGCGEMLDVLYPDIDDLVETTYVELETFCHNRKIQRQQELLRNATLNASKKGFFF